MAPGGFQAVTGDRFRVFVIGGSLALGLPVGPEELIPGRLQKLLEKEWPSVEFEVVNLGAEAQSSSRVRAVVDIALQHDPDLLQGMQGPWRPARRRQRTAWRRC